MRVALHTKVRADRVEEYEAARELGGGTDLFHVLECEDYGRLPAEPEKLKVDVAWQARMAELPDVAHDYSAEGADAGLPVVWELA
ncbi:L-rhamnose mutarotase [Streptomyces sp. NPDC001848]|uniref:L-rhamnose mutarotase n=1 Tax=Streptomyces sp. NPDC001848 TaxID=3364618 RepID=UPI0036825E26